MDTAAELGRNPVRKHQIQPECGDEQADVGTGLPNTSREIKFSGANGDREEFMFLVQLTTSRIGNLTRLIPTLAICDDHTLSMLSFEHNQREGLQITVGIGITLRFFRPICNNVCLCSV